MKRIPEPDLMNDPDQALAYANADFEQPHNEFIKQFRNCFQHTNVRGHVLDLGCGPGDVTIRFANMFPQCTIEGVDGSKNMLKHGRQAVIEQKLENRIDLICGYLPKANLPRAYYDVLMSNSLLHHLTDPMILWELIKKHSRPETIVFVMDLLRPDSAATAKQLVDHYAADEPAILKEDFFNSLCASYQADEVSKQLQQCGLGTLKLKIISDRHFIVYGHVLNAL